jgi:formylglycine-generating enzyme required for sulfatase activity
MKSIHRFLMFIALLGACGLSLGQNADMARKKCVGFGFKEKTVPHDECVKQFLQSSSSVKSAVKTAPTALVPSSPTQREDKFWDEVVATGNSEAFDAYLESYPKGRYAGLARAKLSKLNGLLPAQQPALVADVLRKERPAAVNNSKFAATKLLPGQIIKDCADCPELVVLPSRNFIMGSNEYLDEKPEHTVNITSYLLGKTEVTQGQWRAVMGYNPSRFSQCGDDCPVEQVNWNDAQEFARKLSQKTGKQYRLPSEAEWEYAARAGTDTKWHFGDSNYLLGDFAWFEGNSRSRTQLVAQKKPNQFGLFDMYGNVWEWVEDCYHDSYIGAPTNGEAWISSCRDNFRVRRGGSASGSQAGVSSDFRWRSNPGFGDSIDLIGFRIARAP